MKVDKFELKNYLIKLKEKLDKESEKDKILNLQKLRAELILNDIKKFLLIDDIDKFSENIEIPNEMKEEITKLSNDLNLDIEDTKAIVYSDMILSFKKEELIKKDTNKTKIIIDVYDLIIDSAYLYDVQEKEVVVVSLFDLVKECKITIL